MPRRAVDWHRTPPRAALGRLDTTTRRRAAISRRRAAPDRAAYPEAMPRRNRTASPPLPAAVRPTLPPCGKTGKHSYHNEAEGLIAALRLQAICGHTGGQTVPHRAYRCGLCGRWHITSQPLKHPRHRLPPCTTGSGGAQ